MVCGRKGDGEGEKNEGVMENRTGGKDQQREGI